MQRVLGKWSRSRLAMMILIVVIVVVGLTWALAIVSEAWRNAVIATAGVIAASATAWAAYEARRAAMASASSARDARLALALHNRPWPHVHLVHENGVEGVPWKWYITMSSQSAAALLRLTWTLDGQGKFATHERLTRGEIWEQETFLPAIIAASNAAQHLASVTLEWEDDDKLMRWRSAVEVTTLAPEGAFNPYGSSNSFATSYVVSINNNPPRPAW